MNSPGSNSRGGGGSPGGAAIGAFIKLGFLGVLAFSGMHLFSSYIIAWVIGHSFSTVVYVTSATLVTGTLIALTIAFLVSLNIVLTAVTGFTQIGQNMFGGFGPGDSASATGPNTHDQRSHISEVTPEPVHPRQQGMKLD